MLPTFLSRPVRRLRADGGLEAPGLRASALGSPTVLLARGLCRFERFRPPAALSRRAALAAARLHARTRAPFADPAYAVVRDGEGFGVWWWDRPAVEAALAGHGLDEPSRASPEASAQTPGDGWRVLRTAEGYEAQRWRGGALIASAWRRSIFDSPAWAAFARLASDGAEDVPSAPPPAQVLPLIRGSAYGRRFVRESDWRAYVPTLGLALATASLALTAFFLGQGVGSDRRDAAVRTDLARREAAHTRSRRPELAARAQRLTVLARVVDRPGPLTHLAEAQAILARFGLRISAFDAQAQELTVSVPASAVAGVDLVVEELQASPSFTEVRPVLDRQTRTLTLHMTVR